MVNWKKLANLIPHKIQIKNKVYYEICWVDKFDDPGTVAEMRKDKKQIIMRLDQTDKEKVLTYLHECLHAFSDENEIGLTESQVSLLEKKMIYYWLKSGNLFSRE